MKKLFIIFFSLYVIHAGAQNVGIGSLSPAMKMHISSSDSAVLLLQNATVSANILKTGLYFKSGNFYSGAVATIGSISTHRLGLFTFGGVVPSGLQERLTILDNGLVGIGTIAPTEKLTVRTLPNNSGITHTDGTIKIGTYVGNAGGFFGTLSNHPLSFFTNSGAAQLTILQNGNVGIGNTSPANKLDVTGTVRVSGKASLSTLQIDGTTPKTDKVLTSSNNAGDAEWRYPASYNTGFRAAVDVPTIGDPATSVSVPDNSSKVIPFKIFTFNELFNDGGNFSSQTHSFTATAYGVYQFNLSVGVDRNGIFATSGTIVVALQVNSIAVGPTFVSVTRSNEDTPATYPYGTTLLTLNPGDKVDAIIYNKSGIPISIVPTRTQLSGMRIY